MVLKARASSDSIMTRCSPLNSHERRQGIRTRVHTSTLRCWHGLPAGISALKVLHEWMSTETTIRQVHVLMAAQRLNSNLLERLNLEDMNPGIARACHAYGLRKSPGRIHLSGLMLLGYAAFLSECSVCDILLHVYKLCPLSGCTYSSIFQKSTNMRYARRVRLIVDISMMSQKSFMVLDERPCTV